MTVKIELCLNAEEIKSVLFHPDIWPCISDDGMTQEQFSFDFNSHYYLKVVADGKLAGFYVIHALNSATVFIHANILPDYRKKYAKESGIKVLQFLDNMLGEGHQKIIAHIPEIYPNVLHFTLNQGFTEEGRLTKAYWHKGKLYDIHILAMPRTDIRGKTHGNRCT